MLRSRISPCLLIHKDGLVKTVKFKAPKYVGDPINAVKIFNEKEVDELIVLDIDATVNNMEPDFQRIKHLANECRMPLCYGGGVRSVEQAKRIIQLGVEKVALSSAALENHDLIKDIAEEVGRQSVVVILDVKRSLFGSYEVFTHNGKKKVKKSLKDIVIELECNGVGEIVVNSIDQDGTMSGYDLALARLVRDISSVPLTILGGVGSSDDIVGLIEEFKVIGASAGSLFVFKGKYRAVLINYLPKYVLEKIKNISNKLYE
ncbi:MAG: imidazole glycerol phosphate synthase subunit HisF [Oceanospirillaceae bacterium]|nr:imidazole glycerol phosphate synthase subunit HisF [Oceanospirillaceae bacterium]